MTNNWFWLVFIVIMGACIGSFLNVVIYRLPRGLTLLNPRFSFCPSCKRTLEWWENVPVLGWFYLGGRCRTCRSPISPIYPVIEGLTAVTFGLVFWGLYMNPIRAVDFGRAGLLVTWPVLLVYLVLVAGMIGATVIDAKYFIIPIKIPWIISGVALVLLPAGVMLLGRRSTPEYLGVSPLAVDEWFGAAVGGSIGLGVALVLLRLGLLPQSFAEDEGTHDQPDPQHPHAHLHAEGHTHGDGAGVGAVVTINDQGGAASTPGEAAEPNGSATPAASPSVPGSATMAEGTPSPSATVMPAAPADSASDTAGAPAAPPASPAPAMTSVPPAPQLPPAVVVAASTATGPGDAAPSNGVDTPSLALPANGAPGEPTPPGDATTLSLALPANQAPGDAPVPAPDVDHHTLMVPHDAAEIDAWLAHPHLNREIGKEALFLILPILGAVIGAGICYGVKSPRHGLNLAPWAEVFGGVLCGYLVGGGVVWIVRILGSLGFQKEAMGLGDVHLLAAIGAAMGAVDSVVVFFAAAFLGLGYAGVVFCLNRVLKERQLRIIPYGPYLALAALLLMIFEPRIVPDVVSWFTLSPAFPVGGPGLGR